MQLQQVVPLGRSYAEYEAMFCLTPKDLRGSIVGVADGVSSFNAEARSAAIVSVDPIYRIAAKELRPQFEASMREVMGQVDESDPLWKWDYHGSLSQLKAHRRNVFERYCDHREQSHSKPRYITGALPHLPFQTNAFDLALCSHFLFLYSHLKDEAFHVAGIQEMLRIAAELRLFPLLDLEGRESIHVHAISERFTQSGFHVSRQRVSYEFQRGGNEMMVIRNA